MDTSSTFHQFLNLAAQFKEDDLLSEIDKAKLNQGELTSNQFLIYQCVVHVGSLDMRKQLVDYIQESTPENPPGLKDVQEKFKEIRISMKQGNKQNVKTQPTEEASSSAQTKTTDKINPLDQKVFKICNGFQLNDTDHLTEPLPLTNEQHTEYANTSTFSRDTKLKNRTDQTVGISYEMGIVEHSSVAVLANPDIFGCPKIGSEVKGAGYGDDNVLMYQYQMILRKVCMQVKCRSNGTIRGSDIIADSGDFSIKKILVAINTKCTLFKHLPSKNTFLMITQAEFDPGNDQRLFEKVELDEDIEKLVPKPDKCYKLNTENCLEKVMSMLNDGQHTFTKERVLKTLNQVIFAFEQKNVRDEIKKKIAPFNSENSSSAGLRDCIADSVRWHYNDDPNPKFITVESLMHAINERNLNTFGRFDKTTANFARDMKPACEISVTGLEDIVLSQKAIVQNNSSDTTRQKIFCHFCKNTLQVNNTSEMTDEYWAQSFRQFELAGNDAVWVIVHNNRNCTFDQNYAFFGKVVAYLEKLKKEKLLDKKLILVVDSAADFKKIDRKGFIIINDEERGQPITTVELGQMVSNCFGAINILRTLQICGMLFNFWSPQLGIESLLCPQMLDSFCDILFQRQNIDNYFDKTKFRSDLEYLLNMNLFLNTCFNLR